MSRQGVAAGLTLVFAAIILVVLLLVHLRFDPAVLPDPPRPTAGLMAEEEEEFAELYTPAQAVVDDDPLPAYNPESAVRQTETPAPAKPAPKPAAPAPTPPQPTQAEIELQQGREAARSEMANAFKKPTTPGNTASPGKTEGPRGTPDGTASTRHGNGTVSVDGGWIMPSYADVSSEQTGSIILRAVVNRAGAVVKVEQIGGKAPAAANGRLVEACKAEVRRHTFTRTNDNAPDRAIATITYIWR